MDRNHHISFFGITFVMVLRADFEVAYARAPGRWPRLRPAVEDMLIIDPPWLDATMCRPTYFDTNHDPRKFVLKALSQSSSDKFNGFFTGPECKT